MADLMAMLAGFIENPLVYLVLVFVYAILVAIILPIPIEFALVWPFVNGHLALFAAVVVVMAIGKCMGALFVLYMGIRVEKALHYWSQRFKVVRKVVEYLTLFVEKTGSVGLYIILSIPLMTDTVPIYIYSIFHEEGRAPNRLNFGLSNFLAGINRGVIIALVAGLFGVLLV